jgi:nitroreductase
MVRRQAAGEHEDMVAISEPEHEEVIGMSTMKLGQDVLLDAVEAASRAPSIHNTQPWRFRVGRDRVDLYADRSRRLHAADVDGRDLLLSCGAALHHLRLALSESWQIRVRRCPSAENPDHLASVELKSKAAGPGSPALLAAITERRTDRRPFTEWPVPQAFVRQLLDGAADQGAVLRAVSDPGAAFVLHAAAAMAATAQERVPGYQAELAQWTRFARSGGVPASSLLLDPKEKGLAARTFPPGELASGEEGQPDGAVFLVLGTASDDRLSQLRAGEALSAVLLQATHHGLATCPISQSLENRATRQAIQDDVVNGTMCPQIVLRLGWAPANSPIPPTSRRPLAEILV